LIHFWSLGNIYKNLIRFQAVGLERKKRGKESSI